MNLLLCFLAVFVVGSTKAKYITYHDVTISSEYAISVEDILKNITKAVVQFDENLDAFIDWVNFDDMFKEMVDHNGKYSIWSIGGIRRYFLRSRDFYFKAVNSVYGWCGEIDVFMTSYLETLTLYTPQVRDAQKEIIINSLDSGVEKMEESLDYLDISRENMNEGIVALSDAMSNISKAFANHGNIHGNKIDELNEYAMKSFEKNLILGIIDLLLVEGIYKPEARVNFEKIKSSFNFMKTKIYQSIDKALEIKQRLLAEIQNVVELQAVAKANNVIMQLDIFNSIKKPATTLKTKCRIYQMKHGLKL